MIEATPMEARSASDLPTGEGWRYEPKWDGFRCLAAKEGARVELHAKSGKPLGRYFPEVVARLAAVDAERFLVDGELLIEIDGTPSFEALQMRLHPAESRIRKLAAQTPAVLALFDMLLSPAGDDLRSQPWRRRHAALEAFVARHGDDALRLTPGTEERDIAEGWLKRGSLEGVVAKQVDGPYLEGERAMVKVKRLRTADCVVGGFRYATGSRNKIGSLLLGLYDDRGRLDHVGHTSGLAAVDRDELTARVMALRGGEGFSGDAPDKAPRQCTIEQLAQ